MNRRIIGALIAKDFALFFRNKFIAVITVLSIVGFIGIYLAMPRSTDVYEFALYAPVLPPVFAQEDDENFDFILFESEDALRNAVAANDHIAGIVLPADIMDKYSTGEKPDVRIYYSPEADELIRDMVVVLVEGMSYLQTGQTANVNYTETILGPDLLGIDIPMRDRLRPLFAVFLLMMEMFSLTELIIKETERGTVYGLLVTPMRVRELFTAKFITGITLAFIQAALFMAVAGGLNKQPLIVLVSLLLGAVLVTGISFFIGALSKDFMGSLGWTFIAMIILAVPAVGIMMPGTITVWAKAIPSYYLVLPLHQAVHYGSGWSELWQYLLVLAGLSIVFITVGIAALRRKFR